MHTLKIHKNIMPKPKGSQNKLTTEVKEQFKLFQF